MHEHTYVEISTSSIFRAILVILFFLMLYILRDVMIIFLYAIVVASAVGPFVNWLENMRVPRLLGVLVLYLVVFGLIIFVSSLVIPSLSAELSQLTAGFPKIVERLSSSLETVQKGSPKYFDFVSEFQNLLDVLTSYFQQFSQSAVGLVVGVFGGVFSFAAIVVISFYLSYMKRGIETFLQSVMPGKYKNYGVDLWKRSEIKVGRWLQGQLLLGLIVGLAVYVGLSLLRIKFALIFGLLSMILEIVPIVGPVLAAAPAVFLGFLQSPTTGLWIIIFYIVIQQLESHVLVPVVLGRTTGLNPVVVIIALLVGSTLAGISGAILAVPLASVLVEVIDDLAKHREAGAHA